MDYLIRAPEPEGAHLLKVVRVGDKKKTGENCH
jgi:hypothetical protein